jgi:hypothetical protein
MRVAFQNSVVCAFESRLKRRIKLMVKAAPGHRTTWQTLKGITGWGVQEDLT